MKFPKNIYKDSSIRHIIVNSGKLLGGNLTSAIIGLATLSLIARALGPKYFGYLILIQTYCYIIDGLFNFQSWQMLVKFGAISLRSNKKDDFKKVVKFSFVLDFSSAILATIIAVIAAGFVAKFLKLNNEMVHFIYIYSLIILSNISGAPNGILRLFEKFNLLTWYKISSAFFRLIAILMAYLLKMDFFSFLIILAGTKVISNLFLLLLGIFELFKQNIRRWWKVKIVNYKEPLIFAIWNNLKMTLTLPIKYFDIIIIGLVLSAEWVGLYKVFKDVTKIVDQFSEPIYHVTFPEFSKKIGVKHSKEAISVLKKTIRFSFLVLVPVGIGLILFSPFIIKYFFGKQFYHSIDILIIFIILKVLSAGFSSINPFFIAAGYVKYNTYITFITNIGFLVIIYFLCMRISLYGILVGFLFQIVVKFSVKIYILVKYKDEWLTSSI